MRSPRNVILAAASAALAISALGVPASAAADKGQLAIVNGIPGQRVDFCLNGKEIKSGVRYGGTKKLATKAGKKVLRIHKKAPGKCKGAVLGKRSFRLNASVDLTFVATKKKTARQPNKIVRFNTAGAGSITVPAPHSGFIVLRHAADIGSVVFHRSTGDIVVTPEVIPLFVKGDQLFDVYFPGPHQFWATRVSKTTPIAAAFPNLTPFNRYQLILVGTSLKNARFVEIEQPISLT